MVGASALSGVCSLAPPPSLATNCDHRDLGKPSGGFSYQELESGKFLQATTSEVHQSDALKLRLHMNINPTSSRFCGCGMESISSHHVSTSGSSGRVLFSMNWVHKDQIPIPSILHPRKPSKKHFGKRLNASRRGVNPVMFLDSITPAEDKRMVTDRWHWKHHPDPLEWCRSRIPKDFGVSWTLRMQGSQPNKKNAPNRSFVQDDSSTGEVGNWEKRRAALAAAAVAGLISLSLSSSASAELVPVEIPVPSSTADSTMGIETPKIQLEGQLQAKEFIRVDFPVSSLSADGVMGIETLKTQLVGQIRAELEHEIQVQRKEWGITNCSTSPQTFETQNPNPKPASEIAAALLEEKGLLAWKEVEAEIELEGEKSAVPITRPVHKATAKKVVAASVAVAVAGSVAGAASAAGRAVASSGTTAVATSLTVLHAGGAFPGSSLLAKAAQHLGGGGVAGAVGATVVYPLDTIKTRMQAQNLEGENPQYKDEIDCFKQLVVNEGPASLYSGLVPQLLGVAPEKAMKLTVNEVLLEFLEALMPGTRIWALEFIAGGGGGASQVVFTNPMEIVKVRLQTQSKDGAPKNTWDVVKELGVKGLYEGAGVTLARDVPSSAIFFACYTLLRQLYPEQSFLAGCIAAIPATILVTPMDIIKTRLQKETAPGEEPCTDWWQCLQEIVQKEGPQALFKGSLLRVLRTSPQFGITLFLYGMLCDEP